MAPFVSGQHPSVSLVPLDLWNLWRALWLSRQAFPDEWPLVWLTYFWHISRSSGLLPSVPMVQRRSVSLSYENRPVATLDIVSTRIHDADNRWVFLDCDVNLPGQGLAEFLVGEMPNCRLALLQSTKRLHFFEAVQGVDYEGHLPGPADTRLHLYSLRREQLRETGDHSFASVCRAPKKPDIQAQFYLLHSGGRAIGLTGLYATEFWPHIAWGGWATIHRHSAGLHTVIAGLAATEAVAQKIGAEWFCIETSSAPQYRFACRMYENYGFRRFLNVEGFFRAGADRRDNYIVYGKRLESQQTDDASQLDETGSGEATLRTTNVSFRPLGK